MTSNLAETREPYGSQIEGAYDCLRRAILDGTLPPSEKLRIDFLRKSFGFGASGLREALSRLVADGLVVCETQRGYWVAPISRAEFRDITASRKVVEVEALRQSIEHGSIEWEGQVVAACHSLQRVEESMRKASPEIIRGWEDANRAFHMALIAGCPSRWLLRFTELLYDQSQRYRRRTALRRPVPRSGALSEEHKEIVKLTLDRNAAMACAALTRHIDNTAASVEKSIFKPDPPSARGAAK